MIDARREYPPFYPLAWSYHRNSSRWVHNALTSDGNDDVPEPGTEHPNRPFSKLPAPMRVEGGLSDLTDLRCSCRDFSGAAIGLGQLGSVLHHAYGVWGTDHWGATEFLERPVPSGGGMFPLEAHAIVRDVEELTPGIYHYVPILHGLEQYREVRVPDPLLKYLFMGQYPVTMASTILVITAVVERSMKKYRDRGYRYMLLEAGHVAQNINLSCVGLGLQSLNIGGFFDDELSRLCGLSDQKEIALYAVAVGYGVSDDKHRLRFSE